jgi:DNA-binding MarR family transcriptional regulator
MDPDERLRSIVDVKVGLEHIFFKDFLSDCRLPEGLNHTHMMAMLNLRFCGSSSMCDLSRKLNLEKGSFTPVAARLSRLGYVDKVQSDRDKRIFELRLTEKGAAATEAFAQAHIAYIDRQTKALPEADRQRFFRAVAFLDRCLHSFPEPSSLD